MITAKNLVERDRELRVAEEVLKRSSRKLCSWEIGVRYLGTFDLVRYEIAEKRARLLRHAQKIQRLNTEYVADAARFIMGRIH